MVFVSVKSAILTLQKAAVELNSQQFAKACSRALSETILQGRTKARSAVKAIYNIPQKNLSGINVEKSTSKSLVALLYASTTPIPMDAFNPIYHTAVSTISVTRKGAQKIKSKTKNQTVGQGVSIEVIKGKRETISYAFMIAGAKPRVFARGAYKSGTSYGFVQRHQRVSSTGSDIPIKPLLSITVHAAVINKKSLLDIQTKVNDVFPRILERNISFMLNRLGP